MEQRNPGRKIALILGAKIAPTHQEAGQSFQPWRGPHSLQRRPTVFNEATQRSLLLKLKQNLGLRSSFATVQTPGMQTKTVQQLSGKGLGLGGQDSPVHALSLKLAEPCHQPWEGPMQRQPSGAVLPNRFITGRIQGGLQLLRLPSVTL